MANVKKDLLSNLSFEAYLDVQAGLDRSAIKYAKLDDMVKPTVPEYKWAMQQAVAMVCGDTNLEIAQELTAGLLMWLFTMREDASKGAKQISDKRSNASA